ncbi:NAD(P)-binding protein [Xinfangfangia sp. D13-10-4-6]|uniref:FAD/NAD(P)-binding protein n=1 Tax=Pseudogemmobacter hezensis TaxID=2737662 RepID=UPI0015568363|nr:FAD/NAD(P)-binding protein [Pseudogemmobacter hezensis]NPD16402.1 NAD(P)-binding protein [Pseudogemmobacter hezensis]
MSYTPATRSEPFPREEGWRDVLVIGGGASGVLFAANLLRQDTDLRVTVVEGRHLLGCGIAYSTSDPDHLLNTRVHNMSAFPEDPDHFLHWLQKQGQEGPDGGDYDADSFVGRATYGSYLSCLLAPWTASGRLVCIKANCLGLSEREGGVKVTLDDGRQLKGAYAVLATGHVVPKEDPSGLISGAWSITAPPDADAPVMIIGTGLSMVDQVLSLERAGHRGPITAISRRGLLPRSHGPGAPLKIPAEEVPFGAPISQLLHWFRQLATRADAEGGSWRSAVDGVRPWVSRIWQNMSIDQRKRFLRHAATWWEVHRHRIPPASAARLEAAIDSTRLVIKRAAFLRAEPGTGKEVRAVIQPRGSALPQTISLGRIIDCRGIRNDPEKNATPLMAGLLAEGAARVDPLRLGFEVTVEARLIGQDGTASDRLFALGPVSRAMFWEITAIPDIRVQAGQMARFIAEKAGATAA